MTNPLSINYMNSLALCAYVKAQLNFLFPDQKKITSNQLKQDIEESLLRIQICINSVKVWREDNFDHLHTSQYCLFLYYLSNTIWRNRANENLCTKIFYLNKALHGFECFYDNNLPTKMFIGHSVGIVLVKTHYPEYMALYQGVTVGRIGENLPRIGEKVIFYPNSSAIGKTTIGDGAVISIGTNVVNQDIPPGVNVFPGSKQLILKDLNRSLIGDIFKL